MQIHLDSFAEPWLSKPSLVSLTTACQQHLHLYRRSAAVCTQPQKSSFGSFRMSPGTIPHYIIPFNFLSDLFRVYDRNQSSVSNFLLLFSASAQHYHGIYIVELHVAEPHMVKLKPFMWLLGIYQILVIMF